MKRMICRRLLSMVLVMVFVFTTFCVADLGLHAGAWTQVQPVVNALSPTITFYAPEAIYLNPADWDKSSGYGFKYFIDSTATGYLNANATQTSGTIYFSISQACSSVSLSWPSGTSASVTEAGSGSTRTWKITGGTTNVRRGVVTLTVHYTLASGGSYSVSRNIYMYMPRRNATVGVGGAYQYKTAIGNEPVTAATVLLGGLHKVGGGYHSAWTSTTGSQLNTSLLIGMPTTLPTNEVGTWQDNMTYGDTYYYTNSDYSNTEGDGYSASWGAVTSNGGGVKWCGRDRDSETSKTFVSGVGGQITVDKSRHATMDTIPFLQGGWFIHYNVNSSEYANASYNSVEGDLRVGPTDATFRAERGVSHPNSGTVPYHLSGGTPTSTTTYTMQGHFRYRRSSSSSVNMYIQYDLTVTVVDKSALRAKVNEALSKGYRDDQLPDVSGWSDKVSTLNVRILEATTVLGNPEATASQISTALANLTTALTSCVTTANSNAPEVINTDVVNMRGATFYVPETIYLTPGDCKTGQYFYGVTTTGEAANANTAPRSNTSALVYWNKPGATNVRITAKLSQGEFSGCNLPTSYGVTDGFASMNVGGAACTGAACGNIGWSAASDTFSKTLSALTLDTAISSGAYKFIEWTATYTYQGAQYQQVAYSAVYAPNRNVTAMGVTGFDYNSKEAYASGLIYLQGAHITDTASASFLDPGYDHRFNYQNVSGVMLDPQVNGVTAPSNIPPYAYGTTGTATFSGATRSFSSCNCVSENKVDGNGDWVCHVDCNRTPAEVVVDSSRFSNTNQLPTNLRLRFMITDMENTENRRNWYVSDATSLVSGADTAYPSLGSSGGVDLLQHSFWKTDEKARICYTQFAGTVLASGGGGTEFGGDMGNSACGERYNNVIDYAVSRGSCTRYYRFGLTGAKGSSFAMSTGSVLLKITTVNKSALRSSCWNYVKNVEMPVNWYTTDGQNAYKLQIVKNFMALEVPGMTQTSMPVPSPSLVQANRPGGVIIAKHLTSADGNAEIDAQEVADYKYGDDIYAGRNDIPGYTYACWDGTWSDLGTVQTVTYNGAERLMVKNACQWNGITPVQNPGDKTVCFYYTPNSYEVSYDLGATDGVTWNESADAGNVQAIAFANDATYDATYTLRDAPERVGYTFDGWRCSQDNMIYEAGYVFNPWRFDGNVVFTAEWTAIIYSITYLVNKPADAPIDILVINPNTRSSYTIEDDAFLIQAATLRGYTFDGWTPSGDGVNQGWGAAPFTSRSVSAGTYGDITLEASWIKNDHIHAFSSSVTLEPTCTEDGVKTFVCECGETYTEAIPALGHAFGDWVVTREATLDAEGEETCTCARCSATQTRSIPKLPDEDDPVFSLSGGTAYAGETITVTVSVRNNPGFVSTVLRLTYDPQVLTLIDVQNGDLFGSAYFQQGGDLSAIPYGASWLSANSENNTLNGTLVTYTFAVAENAPAGNTTVTVAYDVSSTFDVQLQPVSFAVENAGWEILARLPGDSDGDGSVDLKDVVVLLRAIVGGWGITTVKVNADVNKDGIVDLRDAVLIHRFIVGGWGVVLK